SLIVNRAMGPPLGDYGAARGRLNTSHGSLRSPFYSLKGASPHIVSRSGSPFVNREPRGGSPLGDYGAARGRPNTGHGLPPLALLFPKGAFLAARPFIP